MCRATDDMLDNLAAFLDFLDEQMAERPDLVTPFTSSDIESLDTLLAGVSDSARYFGFWVQNKNFATVIPEIYFRKFSLLKTRPEYVWMGDYPKMAEQRKQGHLTASGTKI